MKNYKLIKEYPGSPKLGTIVSENPGIVFADTHFNIRVLNSHLKNNSEYWEEIVEKDYEILSFVFRDDLNTINKHKNDMFKLTKNGYERDTKISSTLKTCLENPRMVIYSVKRLSDGEVFTIGDKVSSYKAEKYGVLNSIILCTNTEEQIVAAFNDKKYLNKLFLGINNIHGNCLLEKAIKSKQPLFTTEDGVNIYEGDSWFGVREGKYWDIHNHTQNIANPQGKYI